MSAPTTVSEELEHYKTNMARIVASDNVSVIMSASAAGVIERIDNVNPDTISHSDLNWIATESIRIKRDFDRLTADA